MLSPQLQHWPSSRAKHLGREAADGALTVSLNEQCFVTVYKAVMSERKGATGVAPLIEESSIEEDPGGWMDGT